MPTWATRALVFSFQGLRHVYLSLVLITFLTHSQVPHNASLSLFNSSLHLKLCSLLGNKLKGLLGSLTSKLSLWVLQFITSSARV